MFGGQASSLRSRQWRNQALTSYLLQPVKGMVLWLKSRSAWGSLSCDRRQEWTTYCFMLEGKCVWLCFEWDMLDRYLPKRQPNNNASLWVKQNRSAKQNSDDYWNVHSGNFWEWQPCVYNCVYIVILDSVAFVWQWQAKPYFAIALLLTKNVDDNRSKHSVRTKKWKHLRN